jgi:hypothetical protein
MLGNGCDASGSGWGLESFYHRANVEIEEGFEAIHLTRNA